MLVKSLIFCAIVSGVVAGPTGARGTTKCVSFCKDSTKFGYEPGTTYTYDYTTDISTSVIGGSNDESRLHLTAQVDISAISKCELLLKLKNVRIEESDPDNIRSRRALETSQILAAELMSQPLRFSFQDGKIEHLCAMEEESNWVLNVKRGILSTLQNTMEHFHEQQTINEVDVNGRCQTTYQPEVKSWGGLTFIKTKDLTSCSQRHSHMTALQSIPYTSNSAMQNFPLLSGTQECTQIVQNDRVEKVECREVHRFKPFDREESGARTIVSQTLVYNGEARRSPSINENQRIVKTGLLFQTQGPSDSSETDIQYILNILKKLEHESVPEIRSEAPSQFIELVERLRIINTPALRGLFSRVRSTVGRKYLVDAMPLVSSGPALSFMKDMLFNGELTDKQADAWLTSLTFIKNPTLDMIVAVQPLLRENPKNQAFLGISALINSYCKNHELDCTEEAPVRQALQDIFAHIGNDCRASDASNLEGLRRIIFALKAIGNAGRFPTLSTEEGQGHGQSVLQRCYLEKANPIEVRIAALDALRRMPCYSYETSPIMSLYSDMHEDTEVRIKSYLISMKCANRALVDTIKDVLYTDAVNQVGSFVWTHLTNLQETSSPDKQAIRDLVSNDFLKNKFNTDARKYSRNYEGSLYREDWNAGVSSDANVIFTPDSFLPRSAMVNLTVHLFGESMNILEVGGRVKALEKLLEPIFGPNGYFPDETVTEALHSIRRSKRDANNNEIERLSNIYDQASLNSRSTSPMGSLYTRIFGHEVMYKNFDLVNENNEPSLVDEYGNDWLDMSSLMNALTRGKNIEYTKSTVLLDATYTVTTGAGIPLSLGVQSAATVGLVANGKMDMSKFWNEKELDIQGLLRPSAAIQVDGIFSVQLGSSSSSAHIKTGLKLQNTLHTSTAVQGKLTMKGAKLVQASVALPQDKQEIFKASSSLLILRASGENHVVEQGPQGFPKSESKFCVPSPSVSSVLGLELCGEMNIPEQFTFPLRTPAYAALYLQKTDEFQSYEFEYRFSNEETGELAVNFLFDTPGSRMNRRLAADFHLDSNNGKMDASLTSPSTNLALEGKYSRQSKSLQLTVSSQKDEVLLVKLGLNQQLEGSRMEPQLLVKLFNRPIIALDGSLDYIQMKQQNGKASLNLILSHVTTTPIRVSGEVSKAGEKFDTKVGIESSIVTGDARSQLRIKQGLFSIKSSSGYSWRNGETKNVDINAKVLYSKKGSLARFNTQFSFAMAGAPENDLEFLWETKKSNGYLENNMETKFGKSSWKGQQLYNHQMTKNSHDLTVKLSLLAPRQEIDYNVELTHKLNNQGMLTKFSGRTNPRNEVKAEIEFADETATSTNDSNGLLKKTLSAKLNWPGSEYSLRSHLREVRDGEFEGEFLLLPNQSPEMKATLVYVNKSTSKKLEHSAEFRARGFIAVPITASGIFIASDRQSSLNGQVEIEGNEDYSGKWSGSLDYFSKDDRRTKQLKGKLTLNDRNYNAEVFLKRTKQGDRILNVSLKALTHVAIEATLKGDLPGPLALTLNFYPDKDVSPQSKVEFSGTFDPRSVNFDVNYFGQVLSGAGSYGDSKYQVEITWEGQRWAVFVDAPHTNMHRFILSTKLETPIDGLRNLNVAINHNINGKDINTQAQGSLDEYQGSFSLTGHINKNNECRLLTALQVTGMKPLEGFLRLVHSRQEKSIELKGKRGGKEKNVKAGINYVNNGFNANFEFSGCGIIPEIKSELAHQFHNELNTRFGLTWTPLEGRRQSQSQRIQLDLSGTKTPFNYKFLLTTPIRNFEKLEGQLSLRNEADNRAIEMTLNGNLPLMPLTLTSHLVGTASNFNHETSVSWTNENGRIKTVQFSSEGHFHHILDSLVALKLAIPHHNYQISWTGQKQTTSQVQIEAALDGKKYSSGVSWDFTSSRQLLASIWGQCENQPRISLEFEHLRKDGDFKVHLKAIQGSTSLLTLTTDLKSTGASRWDFITIIDSSLQILPKIDISSKHRMERDGEIEHKTEVVVKRMNKAVQTLWNQNILEKNSRRSSRNEEQDVHRAGLAFNLKSGRTFDGSLELNDDNIKVDGELERERSGKKLRLNVSSTRFSPVEIRGEFKHGGRDGYKAALTTVVNGNTLFTVKAGAGQKDKRMQGNVEVDCSFGHHLTASAVLNTQHNSLEIILKEDRANWVDLVFSAQAKPNMGFVKVDIKSELFNLIQDKVQLAVEYELEQGDLKFSAKYINAGEEKSISGAGIWTDEKKGLEVSLQGEDSAAFVIKMEGFSEIKSSLIINETPIFKFSAVHAMERGVYATGTHTIRIQAQSKYSPEVYEILTTFGLDWNKLLFQTTTPFEDWKEISLTGKFDLESNNPSKSVQLIAKKENEKYILNAQVQLAPSQQFLEKLIIQIETPIRGYSNMEVHLELQNREQYGGLLELVLESQKFVVKGYVSPKNVNMALETPFDLIRRASLQGQWSLDRSSQRKDVSLKASLNQDAYTLDGAWEIQKTHGSATLTVSAPQYPNYDLELTYDLRQDYEANVQLKTGTSESSDEESTNKIGGRVSLSKSGLTFKVVTPFRQYEKMSGKVLHQQKSANEHNALVQWDVNGENALKLEVNLEVKHQQGQINIQADLSAPAFTASQAAKSLRLTLNYQPEGSQKLFSIQGDLDGQKIQASLGLNKYGKLSSWRQTAAAALTLEIQIPVVEQLQEIKLNVEYDRKVESKHAHTFRFSATKNQETVEGKFKTEYQLDSNNFMVELEGEFAAPSFGIEKMEATGKFQLASQSSVNGASSLLLEAEFNGQKHKIEGNFQSTSHSLNLQINSSFQAWRQLQFSANLHSNGQYEARLLLNQEETKIKGRYVYNGLRLSQLTVELTTPIQGWENVKSNVEMKIHSGSLLTALTFQNGQVRYGAKLEGSYGQNSDLKLTLASPHSGYEAVVGDLSFTPSQVLLTLNRNGKEELRGQFELTYGEIKLNLVSDFPTSWNIQSRNTISWSTEPFTLNVNLELGPSDYTASLKTDIRSGLQSGRISFHTSMLQGILENVKLEWNVEGGIENGIATGSFHLDGLKKSFKSSWKNEDGQWDSCKFEIFFSPTGEENESENGFSAHYNVAAGGNGKLAASLMYNWNGGKYVYTFSTALKRGSTASTLDLTIQTPFDIVKEASLSGKLVSNSAHNFDLTAKLNGQTLLNTNALLSLTTLASKLKWTFNAPVICEPFTLSASYDLVQEAKFIELSYGQSDYQINVRADAAVPENTNEIELRMTVNSNVPQIEVSASGTLKAGYKIDRDDTRHLTVIVNSETTGKWEVNTALRLHLTDFLARFRVSSPDPEIIPSIKIEADSTGNFRQGISSQLSIQMDKYPQLAASLSISSERIQLTFNSGIQGFENMSVEGKLESGNGFAHKNFSIEIIALGGKVSLEGKINIPSRSSMLTRGTLRLTSTFDQLTSGELHLNVGQDGVVSITGRWGEKNVALRGQIDTSSGRSSGRRGQRNSNEPWWTSARTEFTLEANSEEKFHIKTSHLIQDNQYSFNVTLGENYNLHSFFQNTEDKVLYSTVQWDDNQAVKVFGEAGNGRFVGSIETPWTSDMRVNGMYTVIPGEELSAKGHFTYDGQTSSLEALAQTTKGSFKSFINVDIPALYQKLNADMNVKKLGEGVYDGEIDLKMGHRHLALKGQFVQTEKPVGGRRAIERNIKLAFSIPSESYPDISVEFTVLRSKSGFSTLQIEGSVSIPEYGVSKGAFGYEIPIHNAKQVGIRAMIDSPLIPTNGPVEFIISTEILAARNFKVRVQYENNDVQLAWDTTLPNLKIEAVADIPTLFPTHTPFRLLIDGSVNVNDNRRNAQKTVSIQLNISGSCSQYSFNVQPTFSKIGNSIESRLLINFPDFLSQPYEVSGKLELGGQGKYLLNLEGVRGSRRKTNEFITLNGEATVEQGRLSVSGKVAGVFGDHAVAMEALKVGQTWELTVSGESPKFLSGKKFNVLGKYKWINNNNGLEIEIECRTRKAVHSGKVVLALDVENGQLSANFQSPSLRKPLSVNADWGMDMEKMAVRGNLIAIVMGERHSLEGSVNVQDLAARLNIQSPLLPGNEFNGQTKIVVRENDVELLADVKLNEQQWRLEATGKYNNARDLEAKLELRTPFRDLERFTIGGKISANEIHAEIFTPLKDFPNAIFTLSGVPLFEPFALRNIKPLVVVGLPWVTYRGSAICKLPQQGNPGKFQLSFEKTNPKQQQRRQGQGKNIFEATLEVPSLDDFSTQMTYPAKIHFDAIIPIGGEPKRVQWDMSGRLQWKTWMELNAVGEVNEQKIEFNSNIVNERGNRRLSLELATPFQNYEKFVASVRLEKYQEGQTILAEFQHPSWESPARVEVDYRYKFNGFMDMDGEVTVNSLFESPLSLKIQSKVITQGVYKGKIEGNWGEARPSLTVEAGIADDQIYATLETIVLPSSNDYKTKVRFEITGAQGQRQGEEFSTKFLIEYEAEKLFNIEVSFSNPKELLDAQFLIQTPFAILRSASGGLRLSPLNWRKESLSVEKILTNLDMSLGLRYNQKKVIQLELVNHNGKRSLEIHNPLRPISLALTYERIPGQKLRAVTEVCWDTRNAGESTVGLEILLSRPTTTSAARLGSVKLSAGGMGSYQLVLTHLLTATKFEQSLRFRCQPPMSTEVHDVGYTVNLNNLSGNLRSNSKYEFSSVIESPWRAISLDVTILDNDKQSYRFAELKWDANRDVTKKIGYKWNVEKVGGWRSQSLKHVVTLIHPSLPNDFTFVMERSFKNDGLKTLELSLQFTPYQQDHLTFTYSRPQQDGNFLLVLAHQASNLNVQILGKKKNGEIPATLAISYVDIHGETLVLQAAYAFDEATNSGLVEVSAGRPQELNSILRVQLLDERSQTLLSVRGMEMQMDVTVHKERPYLEMIMQPETGKRVYLTAGLPHRKEISLRLWRDEYGMNVQDVLVALRLNTSNILSTKLNWRPELGDELEQLVTIIAPRAIRSSLTSNWPTISGKICDEATGRWEMLQPGAKVILRNIAIFTREEVNKIAEEVLVVVRFVQDLYEDNFLFVKDIGQFFTRSLEGIFTASLDVLSTLSNVIVDLFGVIGDSIEKIVSVMSEWAGDLENRVMAMWNDVEDWIERFWEENFKFVAEFWDMLEDAYETAVEIIEGKLDVVEKKLLGVGIIRKAILLYQDYASWIEELPLQDFVESARVYLDDLIWQPLRVYYLPYYNALNAAIEEKNLLSILELPPFPYLRHVSIRIQAYTTRFLGFIEAEQKIKLLVTKVLQCLDNLVRRHIPTHTIIWDTQKGAIEYHQPLTFFEWEDFQTFPQLKGSEEDAQDVNKLSDFYYKILDTFNHVKPALDMNIRDILPPFGAHAVMAGDYHYYTFDKKYFRFAGECSYVLAADLLHQNFSLIVNYESTRDGDIRKKSYSLISGQNAVEIDTSNLKVTLDGRKAELPLEVGPTFIRRMPNALEIYDSRGFQMTCSQSPAVCTVSVSGWYFGKIAGLLGSYDNEQMNDMKTPEGQIVEDVAHFAHSWRVGRQSGECRMKNLARIENNQNQVEDAENICSQHFDERSSFLRPCFSRVDTAVFKDMCTFDTSRNMNKADSQQSACTAINAYVAECQKNGVDVWLPPVCVHCKLEDGTTLMSGENATMKAGEGITPPKSADVVILLEEASCLSTNGLTDIIRKLDNTLKTQGGLTENRYALIGYGGQGPHRNPHIRTSSGQIWAHSTLFRVGDGVEMNGNGQGDLYGAIEFAASTLKFRAGVSKTLIAITCGDERCGSESRYPDTLTLLLENDMKLHMLTPKDFSYKGNKKDTGNNKIFGIDRVGVYSYAHIRNTSLEADKSLKRQINLPKDLCTPMAIETNGSRFALQRSSKKFVDVWARRVTLTAQPSQCQHCECIVDKFGSPHTVCNQCVSPNLQKVLAEWVKYQSSEGFSDDAQFDIQQADWSKN